MSDHDNGLDPIPTKDSTNIIDPSETTSKHDIVESPHHESALDQPATSSKKIQISEVIPQEINIQAAETKVSYTPQISQSQEQTRAKIAWTFTIIFLYLVVASIVLPLAMSLVGIKLFSNPIESSKELVTTVTSVLGGPFGFIVGFYFKQNNSDT